MPKIRNYRQRFFLLETHRAADAFSARFLISGSITTGTPIVDPNGYKKARKTAVVRMFSISPEEASISKFIRYTNDNFSKKTNEKVLLCFDAHNRCETFPL